MAEGGAPDDSPSSDLQSTSSCSPSPARTRPKPRGRDGRHWRSLPGDDPKEDFRAPCFEESGHTNPFEYLMEFQSQGWSRDCNMLADTLREGAPPLPRRVDKDPPGHWELRTVRMYVPHKGSNPRSRPRSLSVSTGNASAGVSPSHHAGDNRSLSRSRSPVRAVLRSRADSCGASGSATGAGGSPRGPVEGKDQPGRSSNWWGDRNHWRNERSRLHHQEMTAGTRNRLRAFDENLGPVKMSNPCQKCFGFNQFSFACKAPVKMCGRCCRRQPGGGCKAHEQ